MSEQEDDDVVARVRAARKDRGWTQSQLAEKAGVSLRAVQYFEGRQSSPQPENLRNILRALELSGNGDVAEATRSEWPGEVQVFLDMMGAYLMTMPEATRMAAIRDLTSQIFLARRD